VVFTSYDYEAAAKTIREVYAEQMAELERMREERHRRRLWKMAWERNGRTGSESDGEC
jgi:fatty acid desaturase